MSNSEKKVFRVHVHEAVYIGPTEPHQTLPPNDELTLGRSGEWDVVERDGDIYVTHSNPRHVTPETPHGQRYTTRVPAANVRDVQYVFEAIKPAPTQPQLMKARGAA